jgi:uncharacterized protein (TIGR00369 family)
MDVLAQFNIDPLPFAKTLGIELVTATRDRIVGEMTVREEFCTRPAVLHGGALMAFADTLGAIGALANLSPGDRTVTIESKTNFLAAAPLGARLTGEATAMHRGRTTMVWQTRIATEQGQLVGVTIQTQLVIPEGRRRHE